MNEQENGNGIKATLTAMQASLNRIEGDVKDVRRRQEKHDEQHVKLADAASEQEVDNERRFTQLESQLQTRSGLGAVAALGLALLEGIRHLRPGS